MSEGVKQRRGPGRRAGRVTGAQAEDLVGRRWVFSGAEAEDEVEDKRRIRMGAGRTGQEQKQVKHRYQTRNNAGE